MDQYLTMSQAADRIQISDFTLRQRVRAGELTLYSNPSDKRSRLISATELEQYATPAPATPLTMPSRGKGGGTEAA